MMRNALIFIIAALVAVATLALVSIVPALILWLAWNALVPSLFRGPPATFWQAFAATWLLSSIGSYFRAQSGNASKGGA
jgi:hypothetical protein